MIRLTCKYSHPFHIFFFCLSINAINTERSQLYTCLLNCSQVHIMKHSADKVTHLCLISRLLHINLCYFMSEIMFWSFGFSIQENLVSFDIRPYGFTIELRVCRMSMWEYWIFKIIIFYSVICLMGTCVWFLFFLFFCVCEWALLFYIYLAHLLNARSNDFHII